MNRSMILASAVAIAMVGTSAMAAPRTKIAQERAATRELNNQQLASANNPAPQPQQPMMATPPAAAETPATEPMAAEPAQPAADAMAPEAAPPAPPQS